MRPEKKVEDGCVEKMGLFPPHDLLDRLPPRNSNANMQIIIVLAKFESFDYEHDYG